MRYLALCLFLFSGIACSGEEAAMFQACDVNSDCEVTLTCATQGPEQGSCVQPCSADYDCPIYDDPSYSDMECDSDLNYCVK